MDDPADQAQIIMGGNSGLDIVGFVFISKRLPEPCFGRGFFSKIVVNV